MWVPRTKDEIDVFLKGGGLTPQEAASLDVKRELPTTQAKNQDIAVDVAAMSTEGGTIIYGIEEDKATKALSSSPIALAGQKERVAQIVANGVGGHVHIETVEIDLGAGQGYLVVAVPPSPNAPHQVQVKGNYRFYGRGPGGNRVLAQGEIDLLYARRRAWETEAEDFLSELLSKAPVSAQEHAGFLHLAIWPLLTDTTLRRSVWPDTNFEQLVEQAATDAAIAERVNPEALRGGKHTRLEVRVDARALIYGKSGDKWVAANVGQLEIGDRGTVCVFLGGAAYITQGSSISPLVFCVAESAIVDSVIGVIRLAGDLFRKAGYHGPTEVLVALTGMRGAHPWARSDWHQIPPPVPLPPPPLTDSYVRGGRRYAEELVSDARGVARSLLAPFFDVLGQGAGPDYFTRP
jgi:hypothetical protein